MANTLRFKRGLVATIPTAVAGEPLFTTDTFDLYIGNGTTNTRFQKYIASGTTSQLLRGDGSLLTMPIVLTSPSNGQVLKYNGTNWVNDSDAGVTGSGTTNYLPKWTSGSAIGNSNLINDASGNLGLGVTPSAWSGLSGKVLEVGTAFGDKAALFQNDIDDLRLMSNVYFDGSFKYVRTGTATIFHSSNGSYKWSTAPSGTAGNAISFTQAMTLHSSGNLSVGNTSDVGDRIYVSGNIRLTSGNSFKATYDNSDNYHGALSWATLQLGNNGDNRIIGGRTAAGGNLKFYVNNTNDATNYSTTPNGTLALTLASTGAATFSSSVTTGGTIYSSVSSGNNFQADKATGAAIAISGATGTTNYIILQGTNSINPDFQIYTGGSERMRITSGGNVGIGNASGSAKLHVTGNILSYTEAANTASLFISANNSYNWQFGIGNNSNFVITEGGGLNAIGTERLRIISGGNVGIGTTSPGARLDVEVSNASAYAAIIKNTAAGGDYLKMTGDSGNTVFEFGSGGTGGDGFMNIYSDNVQKVLVNADGISYFNGGSVGIGTPSPSAKLHLVDSVESEIRTQYSTTSSGKLITGNGFTTIGSITNDPLVFVSNNTERMRFTNGGNLLLGSTSDTGEKFQLTGAGIVSGLFTVSGSTGIPATTATYIRFASGFASPDIGRMYIGDGSGWKFHMSKRLSSTTTDLITFFDNGSVQTSAPTGYAAKPYKLGEVLTNAATADRSVAVEIDGTVYYLLASTTAP
jgi:hypothetical protein